MQSSVKQLFVEAKIVVMHHFDKSLSGLEQKVSFQIFMQVVQNIVI